MGIESALVGAGWSASAASTAAAVAGAVGTAVLGAAVSSAMHPKQPEQPVSPIGEADKPKQASKEPDMQAIQSKNALQAAAAGTLAGNNSTLLTGASGVNAGSLNLGRNTLLGS